MPYVCPSLKCLYTGSGAHTVGPALPLAVGMRYSFLTHPPSFVYLPAAGPGWARPSWAPSSCRSLETPARWDLHMLRLKGNADTNPA